MSTEKVNLSLTIYDVIIRDEFFQHRQFSGPLHRLEKKSGPETAYLILLELNEVFSTAYPHFSSNVTACDENK